MSNVRTFFCNCVDNLFEAHLRFLLFGFVPRSYFFYDADFEIRGKITLLLEWILNKIPPPSGRIRGTSVRGTVLQPLNQEPINISKIYFLSIRTNSKLISTVFEISRS